MPQLNAQQQHPVQRYANAHLLVHHGGGFSLDASVRIEPSPLATSWHGSQARRLAGQSNTRL
jgi:hypothetical protein